jgi:hypothetical protein
MSKLKLRIDKNLDPGDSEEPPQVFATIYRLDASSGRRDRTATPRRERVPISQAPQHVHSIDLQPGHYAVEVALPSGELLRDSVDVTAGADAELILEAEDSAHEWLGWQHLVGNVMPTDVGIVASAAESIKDTSRDVLRGSRGNRGAKAARRQRSEPERALPTSIAWLPQPIPALLPDLPGDPWIELSSLAEAQPRELPELLNGGNPPEQIPSLVHDDRSAVFRVVHDGSGSSRATALASTLARDFAAVSLGDRVELLALPSPWQAIGAGRQAVIEIAVQEVADRRDFSTSVTVRDDHIGVLLGYLTSGALEAARELAEEARDLLYGKMMNPLAAAAGGYALVGSATDNRPQEWHGWIENLCNRFEHVPDGAIQQAQLLLRLRRNKGDLDKARERTKTAYRRGLPFYSMGIRWLLDSLEKVAGSDPELQQMTDAVRGIARRSHPRSPFTILRLGRIAAG